MIFILEKLYNILHISMLEGYFSSKYRYLDTALDNNLYSANQIQHCYLGSVLATGLGNLLVVRVCTAKTGQFGFRPIEKVNPLPLGGRNLDPYPSTSGFCGVGLDPSVLISSFAFRVSPFIVAFKSATVKCKIWTFVRSGLFWMYWPP